MKPIRQGDVWLYPIEKKPPENWSEWVPIQLDRSDPDTLLALGEVTGHAHRIKRSTHVQFRETRQPIRPTRVLRVLGSEPALLTHEEHETLEVPPGNYEVRIQREYSPEVGQIMVAD